VLFGLKPPGGKLPVMVPTGEEQLPKAYLDQSMQAEMGRTHRYFKGTPLYAFAHGLGYSSMGYSGLRVSHDTLAAGHGDLGVELLVTVEVTNNGVWVGGAHDEVVLVFARPSPSLRAAATPAMSVPRQMLLGFAHVSIEPGQTELVTVAVEAAVLRLVGADGQFVLLPGDYELHVGGRAPGPVSEGVVGEPLRRMLRVV
jgi:beta-glucosidase